MIHCCSIHFWEFAQWSGYVSKFEIQGISPPSWLVSIHMSSFWRSTFWNIPAVSSRHLVPLSTGVESPAVSLSASLWSFPSPALEQWDGHGLTTKYIKIMCIYIYIKIIYIHSDYVAMNCRSTSQGLTKIGDAVWNRAVHSCISSETRHSKLVFLLLHFCWSNLHLPCTFLLFWATCAFTGEYSRCIWPARTVQNSLGKICLKTIVYRDWTNV